MHGYANTAAKEKTIPAIVFRAVADASRNDVLPLAASPLRKPRETATTLADIGFVYDFLHRVGEDSQCAAECGVKFGLNERAHPSQDATGPHVHVQTTPGTHGGRGDLPDVKPKPPQPHPSDGQLLDVVFLEQSRPAMPQAGCSGALPSAVKLAVQARFPNAGVVALSDLLPDDRTLWLESHPKACPGFAAGRFDGIHDSYAVTIIEGPRHALQQALLLVTPNHSSETVRVLSPWSRVNNPNVVYSLPAGKYESAERDSVVRSTTAVIVLEAIEAGTVVYYWRNGAFHSLVTSE